MTVGVFNNSSHKNWHLSNSKSNDPSRQIIEAIYQLSEFYLPMGLYIITSTGDVLTNQDYVGIHFMHHPTTKGCVGAKVSFRYWQFFINLSDIDFSDYQIKSNSGTILGGSNEKPIYRPGEINFNVKGKVSGSIKFNWN